jgi:hypothetical protein
MHGILPTIITNLNAYMLVTAAAGFAWGKRPKPRACLRHWPDSCQPRH